MIKILLADDQFLILEAIKAVLEHEPEIKVVGTAINGEIAIAQAKKLRPDILLIDIEMPQMNGILATKYICKYLPDTKVIVLTSHNDQDYLAEALLAGASGYLLKESLIEDLKQEIYTFGSGYSGVKAKLLTGVARTNSISNVVEYREKIFYFKKYGKNIYKPAIERTRQQRLRKAIRRRAYPNLSRRAEILATEIKTPSFLNLDDRSRTNRRKYLSRVIWFLLAIYAFVLAIVVF